MGFSRQEYWSGVPLLSPKMVYIKQILKILCLHVFIPVWPFGSSGAWPNSSLERLANLVVVSSVNTRWQTVSTELEREHWNVRTRAVVRLLLFLRKVQGTPLVRGTWGWRDGLTYFSVTPPWWLVGS